ncbi:MAG: hypothetical protein GY862_29090 [Gammaproteobacteria bacterium]|nr:hypothetical protein [Gammaproteobacteria bacterium]
MISIDYEQAFKYNAEIRAMIMHENTLLNQRIGWMWTLQGLLFTAMSLLWKDHSAPGIVIIISLVGLLSSVSIGYSFSRATAAIRGLLKTADDFKEEHANQFKLPPTIGLRTSDSLQWLLPWKSMPFVIGAAWIGIAVFHFILGTGTK